MTRTEQLGLVRWVRVAADGRTTGHCVAMDATSARRALPCRGREYVTSAVSHGIGLPKALRPEQCRACGVRDRRAGYDRCPPCIATHRTAIEAKSKARTGQNYTRGPRTAKAESKARHDRLPDRRAAKTAWQRAARLALSHN